MAGMLAGCGGGGGGGVVAPVVTLDDLADLAWDAFEDGDHADALAQFRSVLDSLAVHPDDVVRAKALNGAGWCYLRLDTLAKAVDYFEDCIAVAPADPDPRAGLAGVEWALENFSEAIAQADAALALEPDFAFTYDPAVTREDLRLIIAQAAYLLNDYPRCLAEIDSLGGTPPDPASENLASEILTELQNLGSELRLPGDACARRPSSHASIAVRTRRAAFPTPIATAPASR